MKICFERTILFNLKDYDAIVALPLVLGSMFSFNRIPNISVACYPISIYVKQFCFIIFLCLSLMIQHIIYCEHHHAVFPRSLSLSVRSTLLQLLTFPSQNLRGLSRFLLYVISTDKFSLAIVLLESSKDVQTKKR